MWQPQRRHTVSFSITGAIQEQKLCLLYALDAVADWIHRVIGELVPLEPGCRRMGTHSRPGGGLTHAEVRHLTPYGLVSCSWSITAAMGVVATYGITNRVSERIPLKRLAIQRAVVCSSTF